MYTAPGTVAGFSGLLAYKEIVVSLDTPDPQLGKTGQVFDAENASLHC